jgi:hypothetical protein
MGTAIYMAKTFVLVLLGQGGIESAALWFSIFVFAVGMILLYRENLQQ